jgi:hypothetical protein
MSDNNNKKKKKKKGKGKKKKNSQTQKRGESSAQRNKKIDDHPIQGVFARVYIYFLHMCACVQPSTAVAHSTRRLARRPREHLDGEVALARGDNRLHAGHQRGLRLGQPQRKVLLRGGRVRFLDNHVVLP